MRAVPATLFYIQLMALADAFCTASVAPVAFLCPKATKAAWSRHGRCSWTTSRRVGSSLCMVADEVKEVTENSDGKMKKSVESVKKNLSSIRTGRANASLLDRVVVDYYETPTPLNQLAGISVTSAQQLSVEPYDKTALADIEKAIAESDLGLTPNNDGAIIRINIPSLTEERRKELLKQCKAMGEEGKVSLRNVRRDGVDSVKKMEKAKKIGKDESLDGLDEMQKMTDKYTKEIDDVVSAKEKEVMTV